MSKYLSLLPCILIFFGCANPIDGFKEDARSNVEHDTQLQKGTMGIALSGGGLRSSAFAFGALKTLYDENVLADVDFISTVSGGGYTGYEVFVNEICKPSNTCHQSSQFGEATFGNDNFTEIVYAHYYTANFVNFGDAWLSIFPFYTLIDVYDNQIKRKFGYSEPDCGTYIGDLKDINDNFNTPELIVNTTFLEPWPDNFSQDIYEFSPTQAGSEARGFNDYTGTEGPLLRQLVAISGAATKPLLKQTLTDPTSFSNDDITLSDGGHSDNLGAFSLIRRGVEKVIIIDAEHDPDYKFGAYYNLKERLEYWGYSLYVKGIEQYQKKKNRNLKTQYPFLDGIALTPNGDKIKIIYLKAIKSDYVDGLYDQSMVDNGQVIRDNNRTLLDNNKDENGQWQSKILADEIIDYDELFANHLHTYPSLLETLLRVKLSNLFDSNDIRLDFPQYSTFDQSFFNDQYFAFVALGYYSAKGLGSFLAQDDEVR